MSALDPKGIAGARAKLMEIDPETGGLISDRALEKIITAYLAASPKGQVEAIARAICIEQGHNPDEMLGRLDVDGKYPAWSLFKPHAVRVLAALSPAPSGGWQGKVAQWQVWEDDAWVNEDPEMIEHWRSKGRKVRALYEHAAPSQVEG